MTPAIQGLYVGTNKSSEGILNSLQRRDSIRIQVCSKKRACYRDTPDIISLSRYRAESANEAIGSGLWFGSLPPVPSLPCPPLALFFLALALPNSRAQAVNYTP